MAGGTTAPGATGTQSTQAPAENNPFLSGGGASPYGSFSQAPQDSGQYGGTLANYFANLPSYQQPGGSQGNKAFAADLASRTATQAKTLDTNLQAAEQRRISESAAAMKAYQEKLAAQRAVEESKYNALVSQLNQGYHWADGRMMSPEEYSQAYPSYSGDSGGWYTGATGGLASLQGFDK